MLTAKELTGLIAQHVIDAHTGNNWTEVAVADTLKDVTVEEAITLTPASANTITALLHHLTYWNRVMVQRIKGVAVPIPESNGFDAPAIQTETEWNALKKDNIDSAYELADAIRGFDESRLLHPILNGMSSAYKNLQGSVEHVHYHLGQMMILKGLLRAKA